MVSIEFYLFNTRQLSKAWDHLRVLDGNLTWCADACKFGYLSFIWTF